MSAQLPTIITGVAGEAITQYSVVARDANQLLVVADDPNSAIEFIVGVAQNAATAAGDQVAVTISGISKARVGAAALAATASDLTVAATGEVVARAATATGAATEQQVGQWLPSPNQVTAAENDIVDIFVNVIHVRFTI